MRPIQLYHESHTPLKGYGGPHGRPIDFVIIRENCEGLFSERLTPRPAGRDFETDTMKITRRGAERICREAFQLALNRRKHCTLVDKALAIGIDHDAQGIAVFAMIDRPFSSLVTEVCRGKIPTHRMRS